MKTASVKRILLIAISTVAICALWGTWLVREAFLDEAEDHRTLPDRFNHFRVDNAVIPLNQILLAGPGRDGIPAILNPTFVSADTDEGFSDRHTVISFTHNGETRAYPLKIIVWHEIVNDTVAGKAIAVTYCPLCGTSVVFDRVYDGEELTFGVTGLLYKSDVLMYDHQSESIWSQLKMMSVAGERVNTVLRWLPLN
jgi:hypothetical protein